MSDDISLLPESLRGKEEELKRKPQAPTTSENVKMYIPQPEDEDVEIIEVDEGEVGDVLANEPPLSKLIFKVQSLFDEVRDKLFHPRIAEPPAKLPPQFFKAPPARVGEKKPAMPGLLPVSGGAVLPLAPVVAPIPTAIPAKETGITKPKARVMPSATAPRRVRVIRRVRKSVRVSFLDENELRLSVDIPRRRFTLIVLAVSFIILLGGGYGLLLWQGGRATANAQDVDAQIAQLESKTKTRLDAWASYQDLEPRLKALSGLLNRHLSPTKVFDALEANTVPEVSYSSFTLSPDSRVTLSATASSFETAARQVVAFQRSGMATQVEAMGYQATYSSDGLLQHVSFQIGLTLDPSVLRAATIATAPTGT